MQTCRSEEGSVVILRGGIGADVNDMLTRETVARPDWHSAPCATSAAWVPDSPRPPSSTNAGRALDGGEPVRSPAWCGLHRGFSTLHQRSDSARALVASSSNKSGGFSKSAGDGDALTLAARKSHAASSPRNVL